MLCSCLYDTLHNNSKSIQLAWVRDGIGYEMVWVRVGSRYELAWYDLARVRVNWKPGMLLWVMYKSHDISRTFLPCSSGWSEGARWAQPPAPIWAPCNSMSLPWLNLYTVILCPNNAKLVGLEWVWGLLQPGFVKWVPPASHNHFSYINDSVTP